MRDCKLKVVKVSYKSLDEKLLNEVIEIYLEAYQDLYDLPKKEDVIRIEKRIYGEDYKFLSVKNLKNSLKSEYSLFLLAIVEKEVVGFCWVDFWYGKSAYIEEFHIKRNWRGKGIGKKFLKKVEEILQNLGIKKVVVDAHIKSKGFYKKLGYKETNKVYWEYVRLIKMLV